MSFKSRVSKARKAQEFQQMQNQANRFPSREETDQLNTRVNELTDQENERQKKAREGYKQEALTDLGIQHPKEGLTDKQRIALQETANKQINSQLGNYSRMLASQAGARGMRGGAANALQNELQNQGLEAVNQFNRDLTQKDIDVAQQNLAAYLSMLEGRGANDILLRQQYLDYLTGEKDKKRQAAEANYYNKYFTRL